MSSEEVEETPDAAAPAVNGVNDVNEADNNEGNDANNEANDANNEANDADGSDDVKLIPPEKQVNGSEEQVNGLEEKVNGSEVEEEDEDSGEDETNDPSVTEIELIVKASTIDGRRKGACIFCQEYFMDLYLLAELKVISLKITTVDMTRPPADFRSNFEAAQPPILIDTGIAILENEKIERHIMKHIPGGHNLFVPDPEVAKKIENLYNRFKVMLLKQDEASKKNVVAILKGLNDTLEDKGSRFLTGDTLCCFDCELMPKLQHIRVAGRHFMDFAIPLDFVHLWRYIKEMYQLDAFVQSCPADQDIIHVYKMQHVTASNTLVRKISREELETPTYTTSVPESL